MPVRIFLWGLYDPTFIKVDILQNANEQEYKMSASKPILLQRYLCYSSENKINIKKYSKEMQHIVDYFIFNMTYYLSCLVFNYV